MEARVSRLEDQFGRIEKLLTGMDDRLRHLEINVAELKGTVSQMPSTWAMIMAIVGSQIAFAGVLATIFKLAGAH
jgi:hypothetical protein